MSAMARVFQIEHGAPARLLARLGAVEREIARLRSRLDPDPDPDRPGAAHRRRSRRSTASTGNVVVAFRAGGIPAALAA